MRTRRRSIELAVFVLVAFLFGCTQSKRGSTGLERPVAIAMPEIHDLYFACQKAEGKPPAKLADFDKLKQAYPRGYRAVQSGEIVVLWGTELAGDTPIAYEKGTPDKAGLVLFGDGAMREMTAEEFSALKK
jgi:hypothetical protein